MKEVIVTSITITMFVAASMLLVEYVHVASSGAWLGKLSGRPRNQYVWALLLGMSPGCLGVFTSVALYSHGSFTLGAMVTATIASSGDEAFVMLAMFPERAMAIFAVLGLWGLIVGAVAGRILPDKRLADGKCLQLHVEDLGPRLSFAKLATLWRECSPTRGILALSFGSFLAALATGFAAPDETLWIRVTLGVSALFALFVIATVPDHFLDRHLWRHVIRKHLPGVFLWTLGALLVVHLVIPAVDLQSAILDNRWALLLIACLMGLLPESGPHLIFVTLFAQGLIPLSVLLASCVVQDGHGMLPMLAHSRRDFVRIKAINLLAGISLGAPLLALGM